MTVKKIEGACVYKGHGYTDGSHPDDGSLVLLNNGEAFFGGAVYRREGYPLPEEEPSSRFSVGDRVEFTDWHPDIDGTFGTVTDVNVDGNPKFYRVRDANDRHPDWPARLAYEHEISPAPTPPPVTHRHPEGLYADPTATGRLVFVQHEEETDRYTITYLTGDRDAQGIPAVNRRMSDGIVGYYNLVTAA